LYVLYIAFADTFVHKNKELPVKAMVIALDKSVFFM